MNNEELYQKKIDAINAKFEVEKHGNSYDNASTFCFAFILLALAVAVASFIFMIIKPDNPSQMLLWTAYISAGIFLLVLIVVIILRIVQRRARKPLVKRRKQAMHEYSEAVKTMLYNDYGLIPVDETEFNRNLAQNTQGINEPLVMQVMREDGTDVMNLTLQEFDNAAVVFTRYGVPYRIIPAFDREYQEDIITDEIEPEVPAHPQVEHQTL